MKYIPIILCLLLCASTALALEVTVDPIQDVISTAEIAKFDLQLTNTQATDDFRLYYSGVEWDVRPATFSIPSQGTITRYIEVRPLYVNPGQHAVPISIRSDSGILDTVNLIVNVRTPESSSYQPSVGIAASMPDRLTPDKDLDIALSLTNRNPRDLQNLEVNVDSDYFHYTETIDLGPTTLTNRSVYEVDLNFDIPNTIDPQAIPITFSLVYENETVGLLQKSLIIDSFSPGFGGEIEVVDGFLKDTQIITVENEGNVQRADSYRIPLPLFKSIFSSEDPDASVLTENGKRYLYWEFDLAAGETREVRVTTNYRIFALLILIIVLTVVLYFVLRSPLSISKSAQVIATQEGGISMLKVMVTLRNISGKSISSLKIYDRIPHLADYYKEEHIGSLPPDSVQRSDQKGTLLKYVITELEPFEERIITYKIRTQLNILGGVTLPEVVGRFKSAGGRHRVTKSSPYKLLME